MSAAKRFKQNPGNSAICYYRYSSDAQRDDSIEQQREAAHEYAKSHDLHIIKEYEDRAMSGTRDDRPDFQRMLDEAEKLRPAYLILWKTDRLSRDKCDAVIAKSKLRKCGVKIEYVAEHVPDDDEALQELVEGINENLASYFIASHRKNVARGMNYNAERALYNGIRILGYIGIPNHKYEVDPDTAPIVQRIYQEYVKGVPMQRICNSLNEAGLRSINGNKFTVNSLRDILSHRAYIGEYKFGKIVIPDGMPRIIEDDLFLAAQERLEANKRGGKGAVKKLNSDADIEDYWLSDKLRCGLCGGPMHGCSGTGRKGKYFYYACNERHKKHICDLPILRKELIEEIVLYVLQELLDNDVGYYFIIAQICYAQYKLQHRHDNDYEMSIKAKLKEVEGKLANFMKAIEKGIFGDTMAEQMNDLESQKKKLGEELLDYQNRSKSNLEFLDIVRHLCSYIGDPREPETRDFLLRELIDKIYVYPDKLVMTFFYSEDQRELPFEETINLVIHYKTVEAMFNEAEKAEPEAIEKMRKKLSSLVKPRRDMKKTENQNPDFFD